MKKHIFVVIAILGLVIFASGCINGGNQTSNQSTVNNSGSHAYNQPTANTKTYSSANGISFNYPKGWQKQNGQGVGYGIILVGLTDGVLDTAVEPSHTNMILSFVDPKSAEKYDGYNDYFTTFVVIEKATPFGISLKKAYDDTYAELAQQDFAFKSISDTITTVDGEKAYVKTYTAVENGVEEKGKAVWFEKKGFIYVILLITLPKDFDSEQANFDVILNSFKVQ